MESVSLTVKHLRGNMRKKVRRVKDKNGQLQTNTDKILEKWSEHYKEKFKSKGSGIPEKLKLNVCKN